MADSNLPFSQRHGYPSAEPEITIRTDATTELRTWVYRAAHKRVPSPILRDLICEVLMELPLGDKLDAAKVEGECLMRLSSCPWFRVYDIIEAICSLTLSLRERGNYEAFAGDINNVFRRRGYGWKLEDGKIVSRGDEAFEATVHAAAATLAADEGHETAAKQLHLAIAALSRRPEPNLTGAISHSIIAMECVAREYCGDPNPTFGKLLERYPDLLPKPLDRAVELAWGYGSEYGRHLREGREPTRDEAELIVGICATICTYLLHKKEAAEALPDSP